MGKSMWSRITVNNGSGRGRVFDAVPPEVLCPGSGEFALQNCQVINSAPRVKIAMTRVKNI